MGEKVVLQEHASYEWEGVGDFLLPLSAAPKGGSLAGPHGFTKPGDLSLGCMG